MKIVAAELEEVKAMGENLYSIVAKFVIIPALEAVHGWKTVERLKELEKTQWLKEEELKKMQELRLIKLIKHAYENVPYYHRMFKERGLKPEDIKTTKDLAKLPVLTRDDIRKNFDDLTAKNYDQKKMVLASTGGTTGEPLKFYRPKDRGWANAAWYRALRWYGFEIGDKHAYLWGNPFDASAQSKLSQRIGRFLRRTIFLDAFQMSEEKMKRFSYKLRNFKPKVIIAYASAAYLLAEFLKTESIVINPEAVVTTAEKLFDHQRETIRDVFQCEVFEYYGSREVSSMAYECPNHTGLHISAEHVVLEFVKNGSEPVSSGELGTILVTDLHNYAMPFIRYQNGDIGTSSDEYCTCGRNLPLIKSIEGRITDIIVSGKGKFISSPVLTVLFKDLPIRQYQVVQKKENKILIKIVKENGYSEKDSRTVIRRLRQGVSEKIEIRLEFVKSIPATISGKRRVVISKVPIKFT